MSRSDKLRAYCESNGLRIMVCRQAGSYLICMDSNVQGTEVAQHLREIRNIGYYYVQDGRDSEGYFVTVSCKEKYK